MARVNGGELIIRTLEAAGVDTLFTLHGGHLDAIFQSARAHGVKLVDTRHEQAAGHAADGYARATGRIGVAVVTAGPGVTDCVTAIANAYLDCVPTLFIGGAAPLRDAERLPLQGGIDQVAMLAPVTKLALRVTHVNRVPDLVAQAVRVATTGRPGPVFLEIPIDVAFAPVDEEAVQLPAKIAPEAPPAPSARAVSEVMAILQRAERPALLAGGGVRFSGAAEHVVELAEVTGAPVFTNGRAHGCIPPDHPLAGGGFTTLAGLGMVGSPPDAVVVLGARFGLFTGGSGDRMIPADAAVVQVDIEGEEIGRNREVELGVVADCREAALAFVRAARDLSWPDRSDWLGAMRGIAGAHRAIFAEALGATAPPIHPYRLATEIVDVLPADAVVTADGGETATWMDMVARPSAPGRWMSHGYLGCLGTGMAFAIGAKVANPDLPVLCIVGDGSVGLNFSEFDTMVRHGLPIVVVVNNDQQWGMSAHGQELLFGKDAQVVTQLGPTRYDLAAEGLGCHAELVEHPDELGPALKRALDSGRPACVNVMTDPDVIAPVTRAMVGADRPRSPDRVVVPYYTDIEL